MPKQRYPIVEITWVDCVGDDGDWDEDMKPIKPAVIQSVGYMRVDKKKYVELVMNCGIKVQDGVASRWVIPRSCILSIRNL